MEVPEDYQEGLNRPLPNKFRLGLDGLVKTVNYPGCERDLVAAREYFEMGYRKEFLKVYRILKGKQVAFEHYQEMKERSDNNKNNKNWFADELEYPGSDADKREMQTWFHDNPPNEKNVEIFNEKVEGLRNKNAAIRGDRSHPNIASLLSLQLTYPGCEEDVQMALQVHYSRPLTQFPDILHSLKAKQDLHAGNRSHWRLAKLDDLELTYPKCKKDIEAVEDWHMHQTDESRENDILFHEIIDGVLEKEAIYLEWVHQRRSRPTLERIEPPNHWDNNSDTNTNDHNETRDDDSGSDNDVDNDNDIYHDDDAKENNWDRDDYSCDKYYLVAREEQNQEVSKYTRSKEESSVMDWWDDDEREPELDSERF